jgi:hypothetical protein
MVPLTMVVARPSKMTVFPTPGSHLLLNYVIRFYFWILYSKLVGVIYSQLYYKYLDSVHNKHWNKKTILLICLCEILQRWMFFRLDSRITPIRHGLFFLLLQCICMTRSICFCRRPATCSNLSCKMPFKQNKFSTVMEASSWSVIIDSTITCENEKSDLHLPLHCKFKIRL